jgi:hypothetical protein
MKHIFRVLALALICAVTAPTSAQADAQGNMLRALSQKYGNGVVTLQLVIKSSMGGESNQAQLEADGLVIDPSGLVVTTNSAIDPAALYASAMGEEAMGRIAFSVVSAKIRLANGQEIPARVVLRDRDRNLAFVRPLARPTQALTFVNFKGKTTGQLGDSVYILGRLGKAASRVAEANTMRIIGVVDKPRRFYVLEPMAYYYSGNVAFAENGQPLGLITIKAGRGSMTSSDSVLATIIPAADVWEVALQAPQANAVKSSTPAAKPAPKPAANPEAKPTPKKP